MRSSVLKNAHCFFFIPISPWAMQLHLPKFKTMEVQIQ